MISFIIFFLFTVLGLGYAVALRRGEERRQAWRQVSRASMTKG